MSQQEYRVVYFPKASETCKSTKPTFSVVDAERCYANRVRRGESPIMERREVPSWEVVRSQTAEELAAELAKIEQAKATEVPES